MPEFGQVHLSKKSRAGSKLGSAVFVLALLGAGGGGYFFYTDEPALVRHVAEQDDFAVPAAWVLWYRGAPAEAVEPLRTGLEGGSVALKKACAAALATRKDPENTIWLGAAASEDSDAGVRAAALDALGDNGDPNVDRYLVPAFDDPSLEVLQAACRAVGKLGLMRFVPRLIGLLSHPKGDVQRAAKEALESFTPEGQSFGFDPMEWKKWYEEQYD